MPSHPLDDAIAAFARGYCLTRSRTHPYLAERHGDAWRLVDAPRRGDKGYRREEWVTWREPPERVDALIRAHARGHAVVCAILPTDGDDTTLRDGYARLGYRLQATEPMLRHALRRIPRCGSPATIRRIATRELADRFAKAWRLRPMPDAMLEPDAPVRQFAATLGDAIVGGITSVSAGAAHWAEAMFVRPEDRRRGIGKAMVATMLRDDRRRGAAASFLLASHAGALLYPTVGYERIGTLYLWMKRRA